MSRREEYSRLIFEFRVSRLHKFFFSLAETT